MCKFIFLTYDWNYDTAYQFNLGVERFVKEHPDTDVDIINSFGAYGSKEAETGNYEIYDVPDFSRYDGVAIQGNRAWPVKMRQAIADHAIALGIPVVSVNYPLPGCTYIGTDNYEAMKEVTEHLLVRHHVRNPVYITGLKTSLEAKERERAVLEMCRKFGLGQIPVYGGTWDEASGIEAAERIVKEQKTFPDAIICANDDLAESVAGQLQKYGLRYPDHYLLTGFDNREIARSANPRITSVDRDYAGMGYTAMKALWNMSRGENVPSFVSSPYHVMAAGSCGCREAHESRNELKKNYYEMDAALKNFYRVEDPLQKDLLSCTCLKEVMEVIEADFVSLDGIRSWFVIDRSYAENPSGVPANRHYSHDALLCACINDSHRQPVGKDHVYQEFDSFRFIPSDMHKKGHVYVVYPVHANETMIGYYVSEGVSQASRYNFLQLVLRIIAVTIEDVRKKYLMHELNAKLGDLYTRDQLSGLYNRFGLAKEGTAVYRQILKEKGEVWISFVDIDDMKSINDCYGHNTGDLAIHDTAEILRESESSEVSFIMRYGGDEFVVIGEKSIAAEVEKNISAYMKRRERTYPLSFSLGEVKTDGSEGLDVCIQNADDRMYTCKRNRKEKLRNDSGRQYEGK